MNAKPFNVICFSHLPWSPMWKRTQSLMAHLSRDERVHRVIFVNPDVWLSRLLFDFPAQWSSRNHKLYRYSWKAALPTMVAEKVTTVTPVHFFPWTRRVPVLGRLQRIFHRWILNRLLQNGDYLLYINDFSFRPERRRLIEAFIQTAGRVVFDWSDDFVEFFQDPDDRKNVNEVCEAYIRKSDLVLTVNEGLTRRARRLNPRSHTILNGTDVDPYLQTPGTEPDTPEPLRPLSRPLIGYIGWITPTRVDSDLLVRLAEARPDWTIVLMGPVGERFTGRFETVKNIVFLPPVDYADLPGYLAAFDACIIPHNVNEHTRGNNPLKLYQYLAAGKPVVSTSIAGLEPFEDVVHIAKTREEFPLLLERALKEDGPERVEKRRRRARENSWTDRVGEIWKLLENPTGEMPG